MQHWGYRGVSEGTNVHSLDHQVKPSSLSESLEVTVSGDKRYSAIDTALSDERVTKTCLALLCQHLSSQAARRRQ